MMLKSNSIVVRFFLLILIPMIILQSVTVYVFYQRHWQRITKTLIDSLAGEIEALIDEYKDTSDLYHNRQTRTKLRDEAPDSQSAKPTSIDELSTGEFNKITRIAKALGMEISLVRPDFILNPTNKQQLNDHDELLQIIEIKLIERSLYPLRIYRNDRDIHCIISIPGEQNPSINISFSEKRVQSPTTHIFVLWVVGSASAMMIISILFMRGQLRSILALTDMAGKLGRGEDLGEITPPSGALEIRATGKAIIQMKMRIDNYVNTRMEMLTHISHDIRTPLTRIKLILSLSEGGGDNLDYGQNTKLNGAGDLEAKAYQVISRNIKDIERLLDSYLQFAKGEGNEEMAFINIKALVLMAIERSRHKNISFYDKIDNGEGNRKQDEDEDLKVEAYQCKIRPLAIERALTNILDNAEKFTSSKISVILKRSRLHDGYIAIAVEDDGPGITNPEQAIMPFSSGMAANSDKQTQAKTHKSNHNTTTNASSYGLGLAIANSIATAHGGKLTLKTSKRLGGAKVTIWLPV